MITSSPPGVLTSHGESEWPGQLLIEQCPLPHQRFDPTGLGEAVVFVRAFVCFKASQVILIRSLGVNVHTNPWDPVNCSVGFSMSTVGA